MYCFLYYNDNQSGTGLNAVLSQYFIQSFASNEITSERALEIEKELCEKFLKALSEYEKIRRKVLEFYFSGHTFFCTGSLFSKGTDDFQNAE